jgi:hypothetical protein
MGPDGLDATLKGQSGVDYEAKTVLELVTEFEHVARRNRDDAYRKATRNEQLFHGIAEEPLYRADGFYRPNNLNYFSNLILTAASRLQEDRPYVKGYPTHQSDRDVASMVDAYMGHLFRSNDIDCLSMDFATYCLLHGATYVRVTWDPESGSPLKSQVVDPVSGQPLVLPDGTPVEEDLGPSGEVVWDRFSIFDCASSGEDPTDSEWCYINKWVSEDEARQMFRDLGYGNEGINRLHLKKGRPDTVFSKGEELVEVKEVWVRPGGILKDGLFAKIIGNNVAQHMAFPYQHGRIPVIAWKYSPMSGVRWSSSPADAAAPIQIYVNDLQKMKVDLVYRTAAFTKLIALHGLAEGMAGENTVVEAKSNIEVTQGVNWAEPPKPPELLFGEQKEAIRQLYEVFGLNEMLSRRETAKAGTSAKAIAYLQKQDSQKHAAAMRRFEKFMEEAVRQSIDLFRQYAKVERQIQVIGEGSEVYIDQLRGADLEGVDIIIEPASGIERFRAQLRKNSRWGSPSLVPD